MMTGKLFINGLDAWTEWRVFLEDGSLDKLLLPAPLKPYVENKSVRMNGKQVLKRPPKIDERDITLVFCFAKEYGWSNESVSTFQQRLNEFLTMIMGTNQYFTGLPTKLGVPELDMEFEMNYVSSLELSSMDNKMGKIAIRFNEPIPNIPNLPEF